MTTTKHGWNAPTGNLQQIDGGLLATALASKEDWVPWLVYSDWLEQRGDAEIAQAWRWLAELQSRPWRILPGDWAWFQAFEDVQQGDGWLPPCIYQRLKAFDSVSNKFAHDTEGNPVSHWTSYPVREAAIMAAVVAAMQAIQEGEGP